MTEETSADKPVEEKSETQPKENEVDVDEENLVPAVDISNHHVKPDHFEGVHVLDEHFEKIDGAPNFRQIPVCI